MFAHENSWWSRGIDAVAGVDEVGRGCLFGDVVAAAVILPVGLEIAEVDDSKKLNEKKRKKLYALIYEHALAVSIGRVDAKTIDRINIKQASRLAMKLAVEGLSVRPDVLLVDAEHIDIEIPQMAIIKGDTLSQSIAAASIIAKVTRDQLCEQWHAEYPQYGLLQHKGYGTSMHRASLLEHGISPMHRRSFLKKWALDGGQRG